MTAPAVSIVIPAYFSHETLPSCLEALDRQSFRDFETIVVDSTPDDRAGTIVRDRYPWVQFLHAEKRLLPHAARNRGAQEARGAILVFTDPDCSPRPDWLARLVAAHEAGHAITGGAIVNAGGLWSAAVHVAKFAWWLPGKRPQPRPDIATANASYSREVWERVGPFLGTHFAGDSDLNWRARREGFTVWFEPRAVVAHHHQAGPLRFLAERYHRGRDFGAARVARRGWSRGRGLAYLIASPLIPFVMTARAARYAAGSGHAADWAWTAPVQLLGNAAWCAGEAVAHARSAWTPSPS